MLNVAYEAMVAFKEPEDVERIDAALLMEAGETAKAPKGKSRGVAELMDLMRTTPQMGARS